MKKKLLILIVAFNHEKFIQKVLNRIDEKLNDIYEVEILINDDSSSDKTVQFTKEYIEQSDKKFKYTVLSTLPFTKIILLKSILLYLIIFSFTFSKEQ